MEMLAGFKQAESEMPLPQLNGGIKIAVQGRCLTLNNLNYSPVFDSSGQYVENPEEYLGEYIIHNAYNLAKIYDLRRESKVTIKFTTGGTDPELKAQKLSSGKVCLKFVSGTTIFEENAEVEVNLDELIESYEELIEQVTRYAHRNNMNEEYIENFRGRTIEKD